MKVLITTGIFPPDAGGPATYVPRIATELARTGNEVCVVTLSDVPAHAADQQYNFKVIRISRRLRKLWRVLKTIKTIVQTGKHADLLYVNGLDLEAVLANYLLRKPMVAKVVGDRAWERAYQWNWVKEPFEEFQKKRYTLKIELLKWLRNFPVRRMDRVIVPSQYLKRVLTTFWGINEKKITVVYNSFESNFDMIETIAIPLPTEYKVVFIGRLTKYKGIEGLLHAIAQLQEVGLVIIGDGPHREALEALAQELGISQEVIFTGQLPYEQAMAYLKSCDLFVLNSVHEGLPHVILEAMAAGVPVIATAVGGIPEVIENGVNGVLVPPNDQAALCEAIQRMLEDREKRELYVKKAKNILQRFSFERMIRDTLVTLRGVVPQK
jgi:glycosyltransferase involved in cell wall biosynthesis